MTGRPFSSQRGRWSDVPSRVLGRLIGLERERGDLHRRIEARVDAMFSAGLVEETRRLAGRGLGANPTARQAIGYRQVLEHLEGVRGLRETVELVKSRTRQYAKRQGTWFRLQMDLQWVVVGAGESAAETAERVMALLDTRRV